MSEHSVISGFEYSCRTGAVLLECKGGKATAYCDGEKCNPQPTNWGKWAKYGASGDLGQEVNDSTCKALLGAKDGHILAEIVQPPHDKASASAVALEAGWGVGCGYTPVKVFPSCGHAPAEAAHAQKK